MTDPVPTKLLLACVDRELGFRRQSYPRHVKQGKLTAAAAHEQIALMEAVRARLEWADLAEAALGRRGIVVVKCS